MKIYLIFFTLVLTVFTVSAQNDEKASLVKLNEKIVSSFKSGRFEEALKLAQQALDDTVRIYGANGTEAANAYSNLGMVQFEKGKLEESAGNLIRAFEIYYRKGVKNSYFSALRIAEVFSKNKGFEKADEYYLKATEIAIKIFSVDSEEMRQIAGFRICSGWNISSDEKRDKFFYEKRRELIGESAKFDFGILNRKAKSLPKPSYPAEAKESRIGGSIPISVKIDETGNVVAATPICGHPSLARSTVDAVRNAKFNPFIVDGKPTSIRGLVVYTYVP